MDSLGPEGVLGVRAEIVAEEDGNTWTVVVHREGEKASGENWGPGSPSHRRERHACDHEQSRHHQQFGPADPLPPLLPVIPGKDECDAESEQEEDVENGKTDILRSQHQKSIGGVAQGEKDYYIQE